MSKSPLILFLLFVFDFSLIAQTYPEIGTDFAISGSDSSSGNTVVVQYPSVAYNSQEDEYLVVWAGKYTGVSNLNPEEAEIWGQLIDASDGSLIGNDFRISDLGPSNNETYGANAPKAVYNPQHNEYLVVFYGDNNTPPIVNGETEIYGQRLDADGNEIGENDFRISTMGDESEPERTVRKLFDGYFPDVTYNATNDEYMVVWYGDNVQNDLEIWAQRLRAVDCAEIGDDFQVSFVNLNDSTHISDDPIISWNSDLNEYLVVWHAGVFSTKSYQIYGQIIDSTGFILGAPFQISDSEEGLVRAAYATYNNKRQEYLVIWGEEDQGTQFVINGQLIDTLGVKIGSKLSISDNGEEEIRYLDSQVAEVKYDSLGREYVVVWSGNVGTPSEVDYQVHYVALNDSTGQRINFSGYRLSDFGGDTENNPSPALGLKISTREYLSVWSKNDPIEIFGQRFATGNNLCTDGILNGDETSVDCGGSCPTICCNVGESCDDGDINTINDTLNIDCNCLGDTIAMLNIKLLLQGTYIDTLMHDSLRLKGKIPLQSPYSDALMILDSMAIFAMKGDSSIVDWVEIELRADSNSVGLVRRSALIRRDGKVVEENGHLPLRFPNTVKGEYYIIVHHRNHIPIMTQEKIRL